MRAIFNPGAALNPQWRTALSWALVLAAAVVGYLSWGWQGLVLAITVTVFWMLLQFSRALRVMRDAAGQPKGSVASAVMLQARLHQGMSLAQVMKLTGSFGVLADSPAPNIEAFVWTDSNGHTVEVQLLKGRLTNWVLQRAA